MSKEILFYRAFLFLLVPPAIFLLVSVLSETNESYRLIRATALGLAFLWLVFFGGWLRVGPSSYARWIGGKHWTPLMETAYSLVQSADKHASQKYSDWLSSCPLQGIMDTRKARRRWRELATLAGGEYTLFCAADLLSEEALNEATVYVHTMSGDYCENAEIRLEDLKRFIQTASSSGASISDAIGRWVMYNIKGSELIPEEYSQSENVGNLFASFASTWSMKLKVSTEVL